jgi:hypothetical protein
VQSDGKILAGGYFNLIQPNGAATATTRNYIARLERGVNNTTCVALVQVYALLR